MTVQELRDQVLGLAFPNRINASFLALRQHQFLHGLTELQRRVPGFRVDNVDVVQGTQDKIISGATVFDAPDGEITQVVVGTSGNTTIFAHNRPGRWMQQMQSDWAMAYGDDSSDKASVYPTASVFWGRDSNDLMVYPGVPSPWLIGVRWTGIKRNWTDADDVWWGSVAVEALRLYMLIQPKVDGGCADNSYVQIKGEFADETYKLKIEDHHKRFPMPTTNYAADVLSCWSGGCNVPSADTTTAAIVAP